MSDFNLLQFNFPEDLKKMSVKEMEALAEEIRRFLVEKVSKTGGHLASNLGVVEITIALHKVFDSPKDKFVWDVGHQSYVHKILTGRGKDFDKLRTFQGMSGFPKRKESPHDIYDTGHSTTSLSAAYGLAKARDLKGEDSQIVAVIGDGALTGGMAYEALNNIGESKTRVIVILNDNGMSISRNIGSVSQHLLNLRTSKGYKDTKNLAKRVLGKTKPGKAIIGKLSSVKNNIKYSIIKKGGGVLFEELGFKYLGPIDGHNIEQTIDIIEKAKSVEDAPVIVHLITEKGKGYRLAEAQPNKFHGIAAFDPDTGDLLKDSKSPSYSRVMGNKVLEIAEHDERVYAISAAMTEATGLRPFEEEFPKRFYDVGIAEQHAVTFAAGLAVGGMKPLVAIYSSFLQRAYDQIMEDVCLQELPVVFAIDRAGCVGVDGETHHGIYDISYLLSAPGMTILAPRDASQLEEALDYAFKQDKPVAVRYPRGESLKYNDDVHFSGSNVRVADGEDVDIWAVGTMYENALRAKEILEQKGYSVGLVNVVNVSDFENIDKKTKKLPKFYVTIEDNIRSGGFGEHFNSRVCDKNVKTINFAWPNEFIEHGTVAQLQDKYGLTGEKIAERISEKLEGKA